jgi:hypothetical protein
VALWRRVPPSGYRRRRRGLCCAALLRYYYPYPAYHGLTAITLAGPATKVTEGEAGASKRPDRPLEQSAGSRLPVVGGYKERLSRHHSCFTTEALL